MILNVDESGTEEYPDIDPNIDPFAIRVNYTLVDGGTLPTYANDYAAGADCYARLSSSITIAPGEKATIPLGFCTEFSSNVVGLLFGRSGIGSYGVSPSNCVGVIDCDYRGEWNLILRNYNKPEVTMSNVGVSVTCSGEGCSPKTTVTQPVVQWSDSSYVVNPGDRVCQVVFQHVLRANFVKVGSLMTSMRGSNGFGSTGS